MFKIEFDTDNAAFEDSSAEIARILRKIANSIEDYGFHGVISDSGSVHDLNGNRVGEWEFDSRTTLPYVTTADR